MSRHFGLPMLVAITALATLPLLRQPGRAGSREHHPPRRYRLALEERFEDRYRRARFRLPLNKNNLRFLRARPTRAGGRDPDQGPKG